jgi:hypothetical protein
LHLERLEDRTVPSTLAVTTNADSGLGSLRDAVSTPGVDTIVFAPSVHAITLTSGEIDITTNLHIAGPGAALLTISGKDASRVFHISGPVTVNIGDLTVAHGKATGTLAALGVNTGTGTGAGGGGGILNEAGATLTLDQDRFMGNQAVGSVGFTVVGGALLNLGTAKVLGCGFLDNQAVGGGALDDIGGSAGGAIDNFGGPTGGASLTVSNSTFSNNRAVSAGGALYFGIGGAIENNAGLNGFHPLAQPSTAVIATSAFLNNLAAGGPNAAGNGGAIDNEGIGTITTVVGSTINGNRSVGGDNALGGGLGGGLLNGFGTLTLVGCTITNNLALGGNNGDSEGQGGGMINLFGTLNVTGCTITGNQARGGNNATLGAADPVAGGAFGGGIQNNVAVLNISDSLIAGNVAQGGAQATGPGGMAVGGGIQNGPSATMTMTHCVVANNSALGGHGGPGVNPSLAPGQQSGFGIGGGIDVSNSGSTATIIGSLITGNQSVGGVGGAGNNGSAGLGGGISVGFSVLAGFPTDGSSLTLINSAVTNNLAVGGEGGAGAKGGNGLGGGIVVLATSSATVTNSQIDHNAAVGGHAGHGGTGGDGIGGGVYNGGLFTHDVLTIIAHNRASTSNDDVFP